MISQEQYNELRAAYLTGLLDPDAKSERVALEVIKTRNGNRNFSGWPVMGLQEVAQLVARLGFECRGCHKTVSQACSNGWCLECQKLRDRVSKFC